MCEIENGSREKLEKMWGAFAEVLTNDEYVKLKKECRKIATFFFFVSSLILLRNLNQSLTIGVQNS